MKESSVKCDVLSLSGVELLQNLIRFKSVNPPGNETECIKYIKLVLDTAGIETMMDGETPERLNLFARLKGKGEAPPFLMYGHADVVPANEKEWKYPPFEGTLADGCIWGRGAVDMKGELVMFIMALLRMKKNEIVPKGDILLCVVSDEEDGGVHGAGFMTEKYPELFKDVKYAIGEMGGFTTYMGGKRFYPIMISEKQKCNLKITVRGQEGHGSMPVKGGAMAKLAGLIKALDENDLPVHVTEPVKHMVKGFSKNLAFPANIMLSLLLKPLFTDTVLKLMGNKSKIFYPLLHNTVSTTIARCGNKINVIPGEAVLELDGRILPGFGLEDIKKELAELFRGIDYKLEVTKFKSGPDKVDMGLFDKLSSILVEMDSEAITVPNVLSASTDARWFCKFGIQTYGFTPMNLPKGLDFPKLFHGVDERIPVEALNFGIDCIYKLICDL